jgi:hypothetical protein
MKLSEELKTFDACPLWCHLTRDLHVVQPDNRQHKIYSYGPAATHAFTFDDRTYCDTPFCYLK